MAEKSRGPWLSIVISGLLASAGSMIVVAATMAGYAFTIAMKAHGPPDQNEISAFANHVIPFLGPVALALLVVFAAWGVVRRAKSTRLWHCVLVGAVAALPTLVFVRRPALGDLISLGLPLVTGLVGAWWAINSKQRKANQS